MKEVIMYECEFCGKIFKTSNRHKCKYDPQYKNCYTCKHNQGFEEGINFFYQDRGGVDYHGQEGNGSYHVLCDKDVEPLDVDGFNILHAGQLSGNLDCDSYEFCNGKWFENEHNKKNEV